MINQIPVITIDGPSGVGKSSISKIIADQLDWSLLESGKIYRFLAFLAWNENITLVEDNIIKLLNNLDFSIIKKKLLIVLINQKILQ